MLSSWYRASSSSACFPCRYATPASNESWWVTAIVSKPSSTWPTHDSSQRTSPLAFQSEAILSVVATLSSICAAVCCAAVVLRGGLLCGGLLHRAALPAAKGIRA